MEEKLKFIRSLIAKYWGILSYLFFGGLTTLANFLVYFPLFNWAGWSAALSNSVAWAVAVAFAYLTNKPFVFNSHDWSAKTVIPELTRFVGCRVGSGLLETLVIWLFVDILTCNGNLIKIIVSILVVILNYVASKWLVFSKKERG